MRGADHAPTRARKIRRSRRSKCSSPHFAFGVKVIFSQLRIALVSIFDATDESKSCENLSPLMHGGDFRGRDPLACFCRCAADQPTDDAGQTRAVSPRFSFKPTYFFRFEGNLRADHIT